MQRITKLKPNEIFVFGSNVAGRHGAGAALDAKRYFGAIEGLGYGRQGRCWAIPTKDADLRPLPLEEIEFWVKEFFHSVALFSSAATETLTGEVGAPELTYILTPIGCGLAGYKPEQIAPMFKNAPANVILPEEFRCAL
jgi:hypothetical protein